MRSIGFVLGSLLSFGCASAAPAPVAKTAPAVTPAAGENATAPTPEPETTGAKAQALVAVSTPAPDAPALPTTCTSEASGNKKLCVPDQDFAKRACSGEYPEVALSFFGKGTPWSRAYVTRDTDAWNAGGARTHRARLAFDEEVIVLAHRKAPAGGIVMVSANGDSGTYDVLRWDGQCVSVMSDEITTSHPPAPKRATIVWRHLDDATHSALLASPRVKSSYEALQKACDGSNETKCVNAETSLSGVIADFVKSGGSIPAPTRRP